VKVKPERVQCDHGCQRLQLEPAIMAASLRFIARRLLAVRLGGTSSGFTLA